MLEIYLKIIIKKFKISEKNNLNMHKKECLIYYILAKVNMNTNIYIDNMKRLDYYKEKINACL